MEDFNSEDKFLCHLTKVESDKKKAMAFYNAQKGYLSESLVKMQLINEGWKVMRLYRVKKQANGNFKSIFLFNEIQDFLKGTARANAGVVEFLSSLKLEGFDLPDFICKKGRYIKFYEVKNQRNLISPEEIRQSEAIKRIWNNLRIETEVSNILIDLGEILDFCKKNNTEGCTIRLDEKRKIHLEK